MTYKLELLLIIQKNAHKYKIIQKLCLFHFILFYFILFYFMTYIGHLVFYTKLTHLIQKLKNLD